MDWGGIVVDIDGTFEEGPVRIMNSWDQVLRRKSMRLVKVLWQHQGVEETTWEHEKIRNFKKWKMIITIIIIIIIIIIINCHNGSRKPRKFSKSRMTKRIAPLDSSREIQCLRKVSSNSKTVGIILRFSR